MANIKEYDEFTDQLLEGGKTLVYLKNRLNSKITKEQYDWLLACIRDSDFILPTLPISGKPDLLEDDAGKKYLPIFSQEKQMPADYASEFNLKTLNFQEVVDLAKTIPEVVAISLDAFSEPMDIDFTLASVILQKPSRRYQK